MSNTTWTAGPTYILDCTVTIPAGITVTIQPGTVVKASSANPGDGIGVEGGTLDVEGTSADGVRLAARPL